MALRDKLAERAEPYLEPGEQVKHVFTGQTGPSPAFVLLTNLVLFFSKFWIIVVTDRAILILSAGKFVPTKPKAMVTRLPRTIQIGPVSGLWGSTEALSAGLDGKKLWIHKRFHKDVAAADAELSGQPTT